MDPIILVPTDRVSKHYARRVEQILSRFNDIRELMQHEGSKGTRVEREVRKFLLDFLPSRYEYGSGIVIDSSGDEVDRSRQEDVLVLDKFFNPKLFLDEEPNVYPVEVVYCGLEVRTSIDAGGLQTAIENIACLKRLQFIRENITELRGNSIISTNTTRPLGMIFSFDTDIRSAETLLRHTNEGLNKLERTLWPDLICILNRGIIGISPNTSAPRFHLYGVLGKDGTTGTVRTWQFYPKDGEPVPDNAISSQGHRFPFMKMSGGYFAVDVARTFIGFLGTFYQLLLSKPMISNSNLLQHYIPRDMTHYLYTDGSKRV